MEIVIAAPDMARSGVNLPVDIITEILCRLPVKSLICFRCVSKSWYFLIMDPNFIKKHLRQSTNLNPKRIMVCSPSGDHQVFSFRLPSLSSTNPFRDLVKNYPHRNRKGQMTILDVFNGLFCIFIDTELLLWNPSIRESKRLLYLPNNTSLHDFGSFAFSYDSFSDDYIVVCIVKFPEQGLRTETRVYSLKTGSWRKIQECPYPFNTKCNGKFANGLFYWLLENQGDQGTNPSYEIISLELSTEKYEKIPFLDDYDMQANDPFMPANEFGLTVLRGMLCLYLNCRGLRSHFVLWMMKDNNGVSKSWTKMIQLQHRDVPKPSPKSMLSCHYIVPRYLFENGELLLEAKENELGAALVLYTANGLGVRIKIGRYVRDSYVYEESLVSPYLENEI